MPERSHPFPPARAEILLALAPVALLLLLFAWLRPVPAEDAFILFRYAENLAAGHGIVWNVGEDPVEGATEFSWMVLIALMIRAGFDPARAAQGLGLLFSALGCLTLHASARRRFLAGPAAALVVSSAYAVSTTVLHAGTAFATPLYSLMAILCFVLTHRLMEEPGRAGRDAPLLALGLLVLSLTRPEGVLLGLLLYAALAAGGAPIAWGRFAASQALWLGIPGVVYYLWRSAYFGYPFPNTFYVKSYPGILDADSIVRIAGFLLDFCLPWIVLIGVWLLGREAGRARRAICLAAVPLVYMACYARFAMIQDVGFRFLFPAFAMLLALAAPAFDALASAPLRRGAGHAGGHGLRGAAVAAALGALLVAGSARMIHASGHHGGYDDRYEIGRRLSRFVPAAHVMMTTEAGYLPFLSQWRAVDAFGLNDETVAHEGLSEEYIASRRPDLIMFHVDTPVFRERWTPPGADRWEKMTKLLHRYAVRHGYRLVAVIQKSARSSDGYHWYYLRPDLPDGEAMAREIRSVPGARYVETAAGGTGG